MRYTTIGSLIRQSRKEREGITCQMLSNGLCSRQMFYQIEKDQFESDPLMTDILLQRLGKSPDKFERMLQANMYRMVRVRDVLEEAILKGKKAVAERILEHYPEQTNVDKMYRYRMRASLLYHIDKDYEKALDNLQFAVQVTLPGFTYDTIDEYLISTVEMENLLAMEKINIERDSDKKKTVEKEHLEICMRYIDRYFTDGEEHAKIYAKCAWLLARIDYCEGNYMQSMVLCEKGMEGLRENTMIYFMLPLLKLMVQAGEKLGIASEHSKWAQYYESLTYLWESFAEKWYPTDAIFHNCSQKEYHLDYELVRDERKAKGMTQEEFADGIYQETSSLSRFETGKASPNKKTFEKMLEKLGMEKGRYNGYVVTDSFKTMELRKRMDILLMHHRYIDARETLEELKERLDMEIQENQMVVEFYETMIAVRLGGITAQDALEKMKELLKGFMDYDKMVFYHVTMRNEVLIINNVCLLLKETGQEENAITLFERVLQKMRDSEVDVKYRYRSYALLFNNYVRWHRERKSAVEELKNELFCGKASVLPFCINNLSKTLEKEGISDKDVDQWSKVIYYMSDLYHFDKEKEIFEIYLKEERRINIIY